MKWLAIAAVVVLVGCKEKEPEREIGDPCKFSNECNGALCFEGRCTDRQEAQIKREQKSIEQSLEPAAVPERETLPEGLFTRIRTGESKGGAVAGCAANEWLTGGSCSPSAGGNTHRHSAPEPGPDGTARGGRWVCKVSSAYKQDPSPVDHPVTASAICATVRESRAERAEDGGPGE